MRFPVRMKMYLHSDKSDNRYAIEEFLKENSVELTELEKKELINKFIYALYEVTVDIELNKDGTYMIVNFHE